MNPRQIEEMSWAMAEVYAAVTDRILINLARHFPMIKKNGKIPGAFEYQARMLAQVGQDNRETAQIIMDSLGGADEVLRQNLEKVILESLKAEDPKLRKAAERGLLMGQGFVPPEMSPNQTKAFQAYYKQSADKLNLVNTVMLESTQSAYSATVSDITGRIARTQTILNEASGEVVSGVSSFNQVLRTSVQKMVANGLTGFIDHGGHHWSPEAYVAMDTRTTMANTARAAVWEEDDRYGVDLYQVSHHDGARPLCYPWQGKVISRADWTGEVEDGEGNRVHVYAQSETSYGQAAGLFGVNCGHYPISFIPGFSRIRPPDQDEAQNAKEYEQSQQQRGLERKLREEKRDLAVLKAQGASEEEIRAQRQKVKNASAELDEFCEDTGRARRRGREYAGTDAKWHTDQGDVRRFGGEYVPVDQQMHVKQLDAVAKPAPSTPQVALQGISPNAVDPVEKAIGVAQGVPIGIGEARTWANQDYNTGEWKYRNNCQRCVQTYELRRRGYDVEAMPKIRIRKNERVFWGSEIFNGYGQSETQAHAAYTLHQSESNVKAELANAPDGARYSIYVKWKRGRSAHVFVAEKDKGVVKYLDPQNNKRDASDYFARGSAGLFGFFRMDDKPITTDETLIKMTVRKGENYDGK